MAINQTMSAAPDAPTRADPTSFDDRADQMMNWLEGLPTELNQYSTELNATQDEINTREQNAGESATLSAAWAAQLSTKVLDIDYSSREWAVGSAGGQGSAKKWAVHTGSTVDDVSYSAAEHAVGSAVPTGSAKKWAIQLGSTVDGDWSSKEWAIGEHVPEGSAKTHALAGKTHRDEAEAFTSSAQTAAAAAQAAAGLPSLAGNGKKALVVKEDETGVEWGGAGPKNYTLGIDQSVQVLSNVSGQDVSILAAGHPYFTSTDGNTWDYHPGAFSTTVDGDFYVGGMKGVGFPVATGDVFDQAYNRQAALNGDIYAALGYEVRRLDRPGLSILQSVNLGSTVLAVCAVGSDLLVQTADTRYTFLGGDLTQTPTTESIAVRARHSLYGMDHDGTDVLTIEGVTASFQDVVEHPSGTHLFFFNVSKQVAVVPLTVTGDLTSVDWTSVQCYQLDTNFGGQRNWKISPDGLHVYAIHWGTDEIYEGVLSTPWDFSTFSDTGRYFDCYPEAYPVSFSFKPDGTRIYWQGSDHDKLYQADLSTAWDLSTVGVYSEGLHISQNPDGHFWLPDGTAYFTYLTATNTGWRRVNCSTAWDVTTGADAGDTGLSIGNIDNPIFASDGNIYWASSNTQLRRAELGTAYDPSTEISSGVVFTAYPFIKLVRYDGLTAAVLSETPLDTYSSVLDMTSLPGGLIAISHGSQVQYRTDVRDAVTGVLEAYYDNCGYPIDSGNYFFRGISHDGTEPLALMYNPTVTENQFCKLSVGGSAIVFGA